MDLAKTSTFGRKLVATLYSSAKAWTGLGYAFLCAICFTAEDIALYEVGKRFHPAFIFLCDSMTAVLLCVVISVTFGVYKWRPESLTQLVMVFLHGHCFCWTQISSAYAIFSIGLGNVAALVFTVTISSTILSVLVLRSIPSFKELLVAIFSTGGEVLIAASLEGEVLSKKYQTTVPVTFGVIAAVFSGLSFSGVLVVGRKLSLSESSPALVCLLSYSSQYAIVSIILCSVRRGWTAPKSPRDALVLMATGVTSVGGMLFGYLAVSRAKPIAVSVILTSELVMTYSAKILFLDFRFQWATLAGSVLVVMSCIGTLFPANEGEAGDDVSNVYDEDESELKPILD